jgi:hypothetical protein
MLPTFLTLLLAHLISDFVIWPLWPMKPTRLVHAALHAAVVLALLLLSGRSLGSASLAGLALAVSHAVLDSVKVKWLPNERLGFAIDQVVHLFVLLGGAAWLVSHSLGPVKDGLGQLLGSPRFHLYACAYVAVVFGGGQVVQRVASYFMERIGKDLLERKPGLPEAGRYIGWLERFLILTFVVAGYGDAIGFLLAAKAVARYPEIKEDPNLHFSEYFLIGTSTSVGLALVGGILVNIIEPRLR